MFGLGWQEILIILVIAVLVIGPEQLPQVARTLGRLMAQFRRAGNDLRDTINREFNEHEEFKDFQEFGRSLDSEVRSIGFTAQEYVDKEVAKEEEELRKLEEEVSAAAGDPSALHKPAAPAEPATPPAGAEAEGETEGGTPAQPAPEQWVYGPGDFPDEAPTADAGAPTEAEEGVAEHGEDTPADKDPRKETA